MKLEAYLPPPHCLSTGISVNGVPERYSLSVTDVVQSSILHQCHKPQGKEYR